MKFSQFQKLVKKILDTNLSSSKSIVNEGHSLAKHVQIGRTTFMEEMGVTSEIEYKQQCIREKKIMFHAHIGMNTWEATAKALLNIYRAADEADFLIDRVGICLDRRMGLPHSMRENIPAETGPILNTIEEWIDIGQVVPIQPHMGDFMIGFPASTVNTINALKAGITTIGNLSQFFSHEAPGWNDQVTTTFETVRAISLLGALSDRGTLFHSYLEDGFGALFHDGTTIAGWAFLEKYIVEKLLGARLAHCIGGLTTDPVKRAGWIFAFNEMYGGDCLGSMFYGDTLSFTQDFTKNRGIVAEYILWDIMVQLECPTGHAVHPLPVTEAIRIPSTEEIIEAQSFGRQIEKTARRLQPGYNFSASRSFSQKLIASGKKVFDSALEGLKQVGVNCKDPIQLLYVLKKLGPAIFEEMFGAGEVNESYSRKRRPIIPTDVFNMSTEALDKYRLDFNKPKVKDVFKDHKILIASTDVHEFAIQVLQQLLTVSGAQIVYLGSEKNPSEVVTEACEQKVTAILLSTHNGNALDYAKRLKEELHKHKVTIPVFFGGVLNQKVENQPLPVDVTGDLNKLGFKAMARIEGEFLKMLEIKNQPLA